MKSDHIRSSVKTLGVDDLSTLSTFSSWLSCTSHPFILRCLIYSEGRKPLYDEHTIVVPEDSGGPSRPIPVAHFTE